MNTKNITLDKDYFNLDEAATYMGCSTSGFRQLVKKFQIPVGKVPGVKITYRRTDLQELNETFYSAPKIIL
jgi:hypothetical protein